MVLKEWSDSLDSNKQRLAIIPNIIHSLDSSHIMQIINNHYFNLITDPIITIHDCFGTLPNSLNTLTNIVKLEFIKLYTDYQFLEEFHKHNLSLIERSGFIIKTFEDEIDKSKRSVVIFNNKKLVLPKIPNRGNLNFNDILKSQHMIT